MLIKSWLYDLDTLAIKNNRITTIETFNKGQPARFIQFCGGMAFCDFWFRPLYALSLYFRHKYIFNYSEIFRKY